MLHEDHTAMPFLEYRFGEEGIGAKIEELSSGEPPTLSLVECAYHMGYYREAIEAADAVIAAQASLSNVFVAYCLKMHALLSLGDDAAAYACMDEAVPAMQAGVSSPDPNIRIPSSVCLGILEDCVLTPIAGALEGVRFLEDLPSGLRAYCGFEMAFRAYRAGRENQAIGMVQSFLAIAGDRYPVSCVKLHLVAAAAHLRLGETEEALAAFQEAWDLARPLGIIAPFVELSSCVPGLTRRCLHERDESSFVLIRGIVGRYRRGWHGLRRRLQHPVAGESLSILEYTAAVMVVWGWTNREIAAFLGIAETTVKHYLTSVYRKLGVGSRSELITLFSAVKY